MFTLTIAFFKKTPKQQQRNVMLTGTAPHMTSSTARREIDWHIV